MAQPIENPEIKHTKLFINNTFVDAVSGRTFATYSPITEEKICDVAEGDKEDINRAAEAAKVAFKRNSPWRTMNASERGKILYKIADLIERDLAYIASVEVLDTGKPFLGAVADLQQTVDVYRYFAGAADKVNGATIPVDGKFFSYTRVEAIGVVGQIIPWNYPTFLFAWKVAPALACGNCCIVKPAELTPLSALIQAALFVEAGLPAGVLSVINGYGPTAGASLASHPDVSKVAFTGSTATGKEIMKLAAESNMKKVTMELGGKSPVIIFPDCDLDKAAEMCHIAVMDNCGQNCAAASRQYVHADVYNSYVAKAKNLAEKKVVGCPWDPQTSNGAMISQKQMERYFSYVESGLKEGATLQCGGTRVGSKGYFVKPAVFSDVTDDMRIAKEEVFGPLQSILKFTDIENVLDRCNASEYGLGAGVFTNDIDRALYVAHNLKSGITWVNCADAMTYQTPFGGVKQSGFGKELGEDGLKEYYELKTVMMKVGQKNS